MPLRKYSNLAFKIQFEKNKIAEEKGKLCSAELSQAEDF